MVDGIRTGYGVYTYADGVNHYEGQWQNNKAHGMGRFKEEESEYMGQWQDGEKHGMDNYKIIFYSGEVDLVIDVESIIHILYHTHMY